MQIVRPKPTIRVKSAALDFNVFRLVAVVLPTLTVLADAVGTSPVRTTANVETNVEPVILKTAHLTKSAVAEIASLLIPAQTTHIALPENAAWMAPV